MASGIVICPAREARYLELQAERLTPFVWKLRFIRHWEPRGRGPVGLGGSASLRFTLARSRSLRTSSRSFSILWWAWFRQSIRYRT